MGRNRLIYTLADYAIIVASDAETGGTWAGATEALKNNRLPVFVLEHEQMPDGNKLLLQKERWHSIIRSGISLSNCLSG
jgi:predicted Rossmann fold nucleotide-binding protein DprA/Smf involved in DNA uptake